MGSLGRLCCGVLLSGGLTALAWAQGLDSSRRTAPRWSPDRPSVRLAQLEELPPGPIAPGVTRTSTPSFIVTPAPQARSAGTAGNVVVDSGAGPLLSHDSSYFPSQSITADGWPGCDSRGQVQHRFGIHGEFLYLRVRDAEVAYAVPIDGLPFPFGPVQIGPVATVEPEFEPGFRVGGSYLFDSTSMLTGTYTWYEANATSSVSVLPGNAVESLVIHPLTANAAATGLSGSAALDIAFEQIDLDYRTLVYACEGWLVAVSGGVRYASLDQDFRSQLAVLGVTNVNSGVDFDGIGPKFGLDAEQHARNGFLVYGKAAASFLPGDFQARYFMNDTGDPVIVNTGWEAGRIVSVVDFELGLGWQSRQGRVRATAGYMISTWFNMVTTDQFIQAVRTNVFSDLGGQSITFDGLAARLELWF